jgi:hypothetical protein
MRVTHVVPIGAALIILACTSADILRLDKTPRPRTNPESIRLIAQEPTQPYTVIAIVSARQDVGGDPRARLIKEAARLGGQAVLLDAASVTRVGTGGEYGSSVLQLSGKVIVFADTARSN